MRRLDSQGLLIDFDWPMGRSVTGPQFLSEVNKHLTQKLRSKGWIFPPLNLQQNGAVTSYNDLPWSFVWYLQKKAPIDCGGNEMEKRYILISKDPVPIENFGPQTFKESPFGTTKTRPQNIRNKSKPLIYISKFLSLNWDLL